MIEQEIEHDVCTALVIVSKMMTAGTLGNIAAIAEQAGWSEEYTRYIVDKATHEGLMEVALH